MQRPITLLPLGQLGAVGLAEFVGGLGGPSIIAHGRTGRLGSPAHLRFARDLRAVREAAASNRLTVCHGCADLLVPSSCRVKASAMESPGKSLRLCAEFH